MLLEAPFCEKQEEIISAGDNRPLCLIGTINGWHHYRCFGENDPIFCQAHLMSHFLNIFYPGKKTEKKNKEEFRICLENAIWAIGVIILRLDYSL